MGKNCVNCLLLPHKNMPKEIFEELKKFIKDSSKHMHNYNNQSSGIAISLLTKRFTNKCLFLTTLKAYLHSKSEVMTQSELT